jgi:hypothetical protein
MTTAKTEDFRPVSEVMDNVFPGNPWAGTDMPAHTAGRGSGVDLNGWAVVRCRLRLKLAVSPHGH